LDKVEIRPPLLSLGIQEGAFGLLNGDEKACFLLEIKPQSPACLRR
jgi:hypothetical protein